LTPDPIERPAPKEGSLLGGEHGPHDGELVADDRFDHFMVTERVRDPEGDYSLGFDEDVIHDEVHGHLILPPVAVTPDGPVACPVETGFALPNGSDQPFIHVMFEDITKLKGN
jgi:hypothetical protein